MPEPTEPTELSEPPDPRHPVLVITNAQAGSADERALDAALEVLRASCEVEVRCTSGPEELDDALEAADGRRVVVAGGDGSIHAVVAALRRRGALRGTVLGLVPLGTGNDFARTLGVPLEPVAAARALLDGEVRPIDVIVDELEGVTVNSVHVGAGAVAGEHAAAWKERLGAIGVGRLNLGRLGYPIGAAQTLLDPPTLRLRVEVDSRVVTGADEELLMVALGNGRSVGGGTELTPDAAPDDGLIDVLVATPRSTLSRLRYALLLPFGRHGMHAEVRIVQGRTVSIQGEDFVPNSDGELGEPVSRRTWRIEPSAYSMVLPGGGQSAQESGHASGRERPDN